MNMNKRNMLKRKRFHPDETYDSMVVSFNSDDAVSVDPVHGNGKFVCNLNNVNSVTHVRKLLPLRAHVPNTYNNVTEGSNTIQYSLDVSRQFELKSPDNEFEFEYKLEFTVATGSFLVGDKIDMPAFGFKHAGVNTSPYNFQLAGTLVKAIVPEGMYTLQTFSAALDQAIYDVCKADYDFRFAAGGAQVWDTNEWLTHGPNFVTGASKSGWESMSPVGGNNTSMSCNFIQAFVPGFVQTELNNSWALSNVIATGVTPTGTWVDHPPIPQPVLSIGPGLTFVPSANYKKIALTLKLTANQRTTFGFAGDLVFGDPPDLTVSVPTTTLTVNAVSERSIAFGYDEGGLSYTALSSPFTISPGYYNKAQLADAIDTAMKTAVHSFPFFWLHRIRNYYDGGGFDSDVDLRRCEYDATADVFKFYFSPVLTGVPAPSQDLTTKYSYENRYGDSDSDPSEVISIAGSSSFLRMLGLADHNSLALPTDATMTILQSVSGSPCPQIDIPYIHITSPQISRNNVLTSDSKNRHILATIPMTGVPRCEYAHYNGVDIYVDNIDYKGPTSLDKVEFAVTDDKHNQLTIPAHTPVAISLKVYHDDTDP